MSNEGYIKLYHSFLDWEWYKDLTVQAVFLHLLLTVNRKDVKKLGKLYKAGTRRVSVKELSEELGLPVKPIRTAITKLEQSGYIKRSMLGRVTLFEVPAITEARAGSYVKLYRKFMKWEWYKSANEKAVFIYSLLNARRFLVSDKETGIMLQVGDYSKSFPEIGKDLGLTVDKVRTAFKNLRITDDLQTVATRQVRVITVCNYASYHSYDESMGKPIPDGSDDILENSVNHPGCDTGQKKDISNQESNTYDISELPGGKLMGNLPADEGQPEGNLYNKRDKSVERDRVQDKKRKSYADALESTSVDTSLEFPDMDEFLEDSGLLTSSQKDYIREEVYKALPRDSIEFFRKKVESTFGLSDEEAIKQIRDEAFDFQVDCYMDSIEISSNSRSLDAIIKWTTFRYRSKYYELNILQDIAAYLVYETYSVVVPIDTQLRRRFIKCLSTLAKHKITDYELYSFIHWCRTTGFSKKTPTLDVVHDYLFNSRELAKLIANYFR